MCYKTLASAVLSSAIIGLTACTALSPEAVDQPLRDDAIIATKVKAELIEDETLDAAAIRVVSEAGRVSLDGFVDSEAQKQRAGELAQSVDGVSGIDNRLTIR